MFTNALDLADGSDIGQATYTSLVKPAVELFFGGGRPIPRVRCCADRRGQPTSRVASGRTRLNRARFGECVTHVASGVV